MDDERMLAGLEARRRVLGADHVERVFAGTDSFDLDFQNELTAYGWGGVWTRHTLSDSQRSLISITILAVLNRPREFKMHVRAAFGNGCTLDEIRDTLMQVGVYAGMPAGVEAFRLAREVIVEEGIDVPSAVHE